MTDGPLARFGLQRALALGDKVVGPRLELQADAVALPGSDAQSSALVAAKTTEIVVHIRAQRVAASAALNNSAAKNGTPIVAGAPTDHHQRLIDTLVKQLKAVRVHPARPNVRFSASFSSRWRSASSAEA